MNQSQLNFTNIKLRDISLSDIDDIKSSLPELLPHQQKNVYKIENQFFTKNQKAYLITDSTGSGKTYTGLGVIKRFLMAGKFEILVVVPTDKKISDWIEDALNLDISICKIENVKDKGKGVSCTTYANFYQNNTLFERKWDLIIYDESHYLNQNSKGEETVYLDKHKKLVLTPQESYRLSHDIVGPFPELSDDYNAFVSAKEDWIKKMKSVSFEMFNHSKVLYMSATPFAYHNSIKYVDGTLLFIEDKFEEKPSNTPPFYQFLIDNFDYKYKYGSLFIPESGVDIDLLEREFFENLKKSGSASNYTLEIDKDYSRDFILFHDELGKMIDEGVELMNTPEFAEKYPKLAKYSEKNFSWLNTNMILECMKASLILPRIKSHMKLGRKVVVFHSYNNASVIHPFRFDTPKFAKSLKADEKWELKYILDEYKLFEKEYPHLTQLNLEFENVRKIIKDAFPEALEFNGTVPKKKRQENIKQFNSDISGKDLIIIQQKAGREGISIHDTTGNKPRVLINLGLPGEPTACIQIEGRIYRYGNASNAIYEYPIINTGFEAIAFGDKISKRSKTAENLAMGKKARDLEYAFLDGYKNAIKAEPNLSQGTGGKELDRKIFEADEYQRALVLYEKRKKREYFSYFNINPIPEPLAFKIVEFLNIQKNEKFLEVNPKLGTLSQFISNFSTNHFIEPEYKFYSKMFLNTKGFFHFNEFKYYNNINKFNKIFINGSFADRGKEHYYSIRKALLNHRMSYGEFRVCFIIPAYYYLVNYISDLIKDSQLYVQGTIIIPEGILNDTICYLIVVDRKICLEPITHNLSTYNEKDFYINLKNANI